MNAAMHDASAYATLAAPHTVRLQRRLPGPIERVWAYLTDGELRRQWLAAGVMQAQAGSEFELVWRNDELTNPPGVRPDGFSAEHRMHSTIAAFDPPHRLVFTWNGTGEVSFELERDGDEVLLTVTHREIRDRSMMLKIGAGWHSHLDILVARVAGAPDPGPFWEYWQGLRSEYEQRIPNA